MGEKSYRIDAELRVLDTVVLWLMQGYRLALLTKVSGGERWGMLGAPCRWFAVREDGVTTAMSVEGPNAEAIVTAVRSGELLQGASRLLYYPTRLADFGAYRQGLSPKLLLLLEPNPDLALLESLRSRLARNERVMREVELGGSSRLLSSDCVVRPGFDGRVLRLSFGPAQSGRLAETALIAVRRRRSDAPRVQRSR